jgi:hypothetical protein
MGWLKAAAGQLRGRGGGRALGAGFSAEQRQHYNTGHTCVVHPNAATDVGDQHLGVSRVQHLLNGPLGSIRETQESSNTHTHTNHQPRQHVGLCGEGGGEAKVYHADARA